MFIRLYVAETYLFVFYGHATDLVHVTVFPVWVSPLLENGSIVVSLVTSRVAVSFTNARLPSLVVVDTGPCTTFYDRRLMRMLWLGY